MTEEDPFSADVVGGSSERFADVYHDDSLIMSADEHDGELIVLVFDPDDPTDAIEEFRWNL